MTFKHTKFEDSVTMRSLEKLARNKGWVKDEPIVKSAANKLDLSPTESLTENVLKLCAGLKSLGFEKYAVELETKLLNYKQAQTLYDVSKETGEDLVHAAHPKGSHKLEDVDSSEAVFEDIIDKHLKHVEVTEKQPTGKLASSLDVIRAVKVVLAQQQQLSEEQLIPLRADKAVAQLKSVLPILDKARTSILSKMNTTTLAHSFETNYNEIKQVTDPLTRDNISVKSIDSVLGDLQDIQIAINFFNWKDLGVFLGPLALAALLRHVGDVVDVVSGDWDQALRDKLTGYVDSAKSAANKARAFIRGEADSEVVQAATKQEAGQTITLKDVTLKQSPLDKYLNQIDDLSDHIKTWQAAVTDRASAKWITDEIAALKGLSDRYDQISDSPNAAGMVPNLQAAIASELKDINDFARARNLPAPKNSLPQA